MSWRDDLPEIPTERIRGHVVSEGRARRAAARQRRRAQLTGGGLAAVVVLAVAGIVATSGRSDDRGDDSAASQTTAVAAAATVAPSETRPGTSPTTPATVPVSTVATEESAAAGAATTVPSGIRVLVEPGTVWEVPTVGGTPCGPVAFSVTATAPGARRVVATVRTSEGLLVERDMVVEGDVATVVFDGFPSGTVAAGSRADLLVEVAVTDSSGALHRVTGPVVTLLDCPP